MSMTYTCGHVVTMSRVDEARNAYPALCPLCGAPLYPDVEIWAQVENRKAGELGGELKAEVETVSRASRRKWRGER